ncbi:melanoma-associated antigen B1-like [Echinops telfairi]|uniref:Melanoma-associated antigen B1-like n=1 Tax=Echinops telfairi TaxID=9371 RepID=A0ABM0IZ62_ECHTE|nr:melanoma-associated antigen B1-like [Echinops telfairi]
MDRGHKHKRRGRRTRRHRRDTRRAQEEGLPLSSSPPVGEYLQSLPVVPVSQGPLAAQSSTTAAAGDACTRAATGQEGGRPSSGVPPPTDSDPKALISTMVGALLQLLLEKYKMKEPIVKAEMMKVLGRNCKESFPEIVKITTEMLELVFCLDLKEMDTNKESYVLLQKLHLTEDEEYLESVGDTEFPRNGLLMALLALIYIKGGRVTEEEMWKYLNMLGVYDGENHVFFGEPRKFINKDLIEEKYLECVQVPNSDPPSYEFLWGPRALAVISKMQALEFFAKLTDTVPTDFPLQYEAALRDQEIRARARVAAIARASSGPTSGSFSHP